MISRQAPYWTKAQALLIEQYRNSANFQACLKAVFDQYDHVENLLFTVLSMADLRNRLLEGAPTGLRLDRIGALAAIDRIAGETDDAYWFRIIAELGNGSAGTPEGILRKARQYTEGAVTYTPEYPAGYWLLATDRHRNLTQEFVDQISPAGVQGMVGCCLCDVEGDLIVTATGDAILVVGPCDSANLVTETDAALITETGKQILVEE